MISKRQNICIIFQLGHVVISRKTILEEQFKSFIFQHFSIVSEAKFVEWQRN